MNSRGAGLWHPTVDPDVRIGSKADAASKTLGVRFTPNNGHGSQPTACLLWAKSRQSVLQQERTLFDHLVRALQERFRDVQAECLRCPEIDH